MKEEKKITRKAAIKKTGLAAASAVTMMVLLNNNANAAGKLPKGWYPDWKPPVCDPKGSPGQNN